MGTVSDRFKMAKKDNSQKNKDLPVPLDDKVGSSASSDKTIKSKSSKQDVKVTKKSNADNKDDKYEDEEYDDESIESFWDEYNNLLKEIEKEEKQEDSQNSHSDTQSFREKFAKTSNNKHLVHKNDTPSLVHKEIAHNTTDDKATSEKTKQNKESLTTTNLVFKKRESISYTPKIAKIVSIALVFILSAILCYILSENNAPLSFQNQNKVAVKNDEKTINDDSLNQNNIIKIENIFGDKIVIDKRYISGSTISSVNKQSKKVDSVQTVLAKILKKGDVVVDVGSGLGINALYMRHFITESGHLYCFERQKEVFEMLQKSIEINNFHNIDVYNRFVFDLNTKAQLKIIEDENEKYSVIIDRLEAKKVSNITKIDTSSLDNILWDVDSINLIHINSHNSEIEILKGANHIINRSKDIKIISSWYANKKEEKRYEDFINAIRNMGFSFWIINSDGSLTIVENDNVLFHNKQIKILIAKSIK